MINDLPEARWGCLRGLAKERGGKEGLGAPVGSKYHLLGRGKEPVLLGEGQEGCGMGQFELGGAGDALLERCGCAFRVPRGGRPSEAVRGTVGRIPLATFVTVGLGCGMAPLMGTGGICSWVIWGLRFPPPRKSIVSPG